MKTANALERVLNKYMTSVTPYARSVSESFPVFVRDIETIRQGADEAFLHTWQAAGIHETPAGKAKDSLSPP